MFFIIVAASIELVALTQTVTEGQSKSLYCNASGNPNPMVSWTKIGTGPVLNENVLNFTSINRTDAGTYKCEATNECGNATTMTTIVVHCKYSAFMHSCPFQLPTLFSESTFAV